ncbi:MAG: membrane protein insertase YidC [candidate division KSB1 bacterium]|jgi:YidC/Oxa1 family membrane protein insertase|nr:membrane protein insertase YidC [candidate division KSB1 bacterium]
MDKRTVLAFILIGALLVFTQTDYYKEKVLGLEKVEPTYEQEMPSEEKVVEDVKPLEKPDDDMQSPTAGPAGDDVTSQIESNLTTGTGEDIEIYTSKYKAVFSTKGATVRRWELTDYFYGTESEIPVQLIKDDGYGNLAVKFAVDEDTLMTHDFLFSADKKTVHLSESNTEATVRFVLELGDRQKLIKTYTFYNDTYHFDLDVELINLDDMISDQKYTLDWLSGLNLTEKNTKEDLNNSKAYIFTGGDKEELSISAKPKESKTLGPVEGQIDWIGIRSKYFISAIFPKSDNDVSAKLKANSFKSSTGEFYKNYSGHLQMKIPERNKNNYAERFQVYIGPLDYSTVKQYHSGFEKIMGWGPGFIRPFSKLVISVFKFLHNYIPNYGWVLIIFSILVKIVVFPLTRKSYVSMHEMQKLQPLMAELKEKYQNDPQRMNKETMKLYKEHGVNPLSGCLPMLLQMPLLWSIFLVFRNTIQLRQEPFILWIKDLSAPDTIATLPFSLPFLGADLHIIPLLMGATMFLQQKMTMRDPKQKAMVYIMPLFLTFIFYSFPSGLNLYYTLFNVFSMLQQKFTPDRKDTGDVAPALSKK